MRWFKHLVDSGDDPDLQEAIYYFGSDAYYVFFRTMEIMAREYKEETPGFNCFLFETYRKKYRISGRKLMTILEFFDQKKRILVRTFDKDKNIYIELNCPKLKELTERKSTDSVRKFREKNRSGNADETVSETETEQREVEVEVDKRKQRSAEDSADQGPDPGVKIYSAVIEMLKKYGIRGNQAHLMVSTGSAEFIFRKILYLNFFLENPAAQNNGGIKEPGGWVIRACENDYGEPLGFMAWVGRRLEDWIRDPAFPDCIKKEMKFIAEGGGN